MKNLICIALSFQFTFAGFAFAGPPVEINLAERQKTVPEILKQFIEKHANDEFAYELTQAELDKAVAEAKGKTEAIFNEQAKKLAHKFDTPKDVKAQKERLLAQQALDEEAQVLVDGLFKDVIAGRRSITDLNILPMAIADEYVFESEKAGVLSFVVDAITNAHFSPDQVDELRKQASAKYKNARDTYWVYMAFLAVAAVGILRRAPVLIETYFPKWAQRESRKAAEKAIEQSKGALTPALGKDIAQNASKTRDERFDQVIRELEALGASETRVPPSQLRKSVDNISRSWMMQKISENKPLHLMQKYGLFGFAKYSAITYGVAKGVSYTDIYGSLFYENHYGNKFDNTYMNPEKIEINENIMSDYFQGLAVLNLSCKSRALVASTARPMTDEEHLANIKKLNALYVDYRLYLNFSPRYETPTALPNTVAADPKTGVVSYKIPALNTFATDHFACEKLKGTTAKLVSVSLTEVLSDIMLSFEQLKKTDK